uniref:Uncharacterized protein n=1 Tax=Populus alba TaxID=43335 RepID=A0A4U5Q721_POPAL|nr:hypothetical protein D5086_0000126730 [Populus alba]
MDANWFSALFDKHYENVMNNVGRYVSDGFVGTSSASGFGDSFGDRYVNYDSEAQHDDLNQVMPLTLGIIPAMTSESCHGRQRSLKRPSSMNTLDSYCHSQTQSAQNSSREDLHDHMRGRGGGSKRFFHCSPLMAARHLSTYLGVSQAKKIRGIGDTKQQDQQRKQEEQDNAPKWSPHSYELCF